MQSYTISLLLITGLFLTACSDDTSPTVSKMPSSQESSWQQQPAAARPPLDRSLDFAKVSRGAKLFAENCVSCHGPQAEGGPLWNKTGPVTKNPSPPLNGTGHTWYHPTAVLKRIIMHGSAQLGSGMPAWSDKLSDEDMEAIIAWFQSLWSDEKYATWVRIDAEVRRNQVTP
ncbi:MAG: c-type cytochrome [Acidiferrobacterales bacterium]